MADQFRVLINFRHAILTSDYRDQAVAELLEDVAGRVRSGQTCGALRDANGATVGDFGTHSEGTVP